MHNVSINATLMLVVTKLKFVPVLKLVEFKTVRMTITVTAIITGATGIRLAAYVPRAIAEIAIGAANPIVIDIKPDKNPNAHNTGCDVHVHIHCCNKEEGK